MKAYWGALTVLMLVWTGCNKKPEPVVVDMNITETNTTVEEPKLGIYDWQMNDEILTEGSAAKVVVVKSKRVMILFDEEGKVLSRHRISLGDNPVGTKLKQGDKKTPEGSYNIIDKRSDPKYYREMLLSYPNSEDRKRSKELGFNAGGGITIHAQVPWNWDGHGNDYTLANDWTNGCMAMTNEGMDIAWNMISLGTVIEIRE